MRDAGTKEYKIREREKTKRKKKNECLLCANNYVGMRRVYLVSEPDVHILSHISKPESRGEVGNIHKTDVVLTLSASIYVHSSFAYICMYIILRTVTEEAKYFLQ